MKLAWILPPLAFVAFGGTLWMARSGRVPSPRQLLDSAKASLAAEPPDRATALRELDQALSLLGDTDDRALLAELLTERSQVYQASGQPALALDDCRTQLARCGPDVGALSRAAEFSLWLDQPGASLEFATQLLPLDPANAPARVGRARVALADVPLAAIEELARTVLPREDAKAVVRLAQRAAVHAAEPDVHGAALEELLQHFPAQAQRRQVDELVEQASEHLEAAREAFVASLGPNTTTDAIAGLQDLLLRGGADIDAADLGHVALALPRLRSPMPVLARTASTLMELGRKDTAKKLVVEVRGRSQGGPGSATLPSSALRDDLLEWCEMARELELWDELRRSATELATRGTQRRDPSKALRGRLLMAEADMAQKRIEPARKTLEWVTAQPVRVPGVMQRAWLDLAQLASQQRNRSRERFALLTATRLVPLDPPLELRGDVSRAWLRLYELQTADEDWLQAETSLTHALRCAVDGVEDLEKRWTELARTSVGRPDRGGVFRDILRARQALEEGQPAEAGDTARQVLARFPGLGPALEILSAAALEVGDHATVIKTALELLERHWPGGAGSARLRAVPPDQFLPQDRVRWMYLDPRGALQGVLARLLADDDRESAVLAARAQLPTDQPPDVVASAGVLLLEAGDAPGARATFELLPGASAAYREVAGSALLAALDTALEEGDDAPLSEALAKALASGTPQDLELVRAAQALLTCDRGEDADALLAWLVSEPSPLLGEALLCSAVRRIADRSTASTDEHLERAAGLLEPGRPDFARLLLAADGGPIDALGREAQWVLGTPLASTRARRVLLAVLAGDYPAATSAVRGAALDGRDPALDLAAALLRALAPAEALGGDPPLLLPELDRPLRGLELADLVVVALASDVAPHALWALARLDEWPTEVRTSTWGRILAAQALRSLGRLDEAAAELVPLVVDGAGPPAAWALRANIEMDRQGEDAALPYRIGWLVASGNLASSERELAPLVAAALVERGERETAVRHVEGLLAAHPDDPLLLEPLARLESVPGRRARAAELYVDLVHALPPAERSAPVLTLLEMLRAAREAGEISEARWWSEVEAVEAESPEDPAPPRELATRAFEQPTALGGPGGLARTQALDRLERFRARTLGRPVESLRAGEARRWTQLFARFTPERAVRFARAELEADPLDPEVWRAYAEALIAARRWAEALATLDSCMAVAPQRETARLHCLLGYHVNENMADFRERLDRLERIDPGAADDPVLAFYRALAALRKGDGPAAELAQPCLALWSERVANGLSESQHGRALAIALFDAGLSSEALEVLRQSIALEKSPLAADVLRALAYLVETERKDAAAAAKREAEKKAKEAEAGEAATEATADDDAPGDRPAVEPADKPAPKPGAKGKAGQGGGGPKAKGQKPGGAKGPKAKR